MPAVYQSLYLIFNKDIAVFKKTCIFLRCNKNWQIPIVIFLSLAFPLLPPNCGLGKLLLKIPLIPGMYSISNLSWDNKPYRPETFMVKLHISCDIVFKSISLIHVKSFWFKLKSLKNFTSSRLSSAEWENEPGGKSDSNFGQNLVYHLFVWDTGELFKLSEPCQSQFSLPVVR